MSEDSVIDLLCTYDNIIKKSKCNNTECTQSEPPKINSFMKKCKTKKKHICDICNKEFTNKCGLTNHLLIHAGVKPFACEICYKTFTKKCTLTVHLVTHSTERPFVCEVCDKSFSRKNDLKKHKFVHTDKKNYVCDICKADFKHQNNLRRHKMRHFSKEQKNVSKVVKKQDALISLLIESYKKKQNLVDNGRISGDPSVTKDAQEKFTLPIDKNEHIITSESEIITEIIDVNEILGTSNNGDVSDIKNVTHLEDAFNSVSNSNISKENFIESHNSNKDLQDNFMNHKINEKLYQKASDEKNFLKVNSKLDSTLKSPLHMNDYEHDLKTNSLIKQGVGKEDLSVFKSSIGNVSANSHNVIDNFIKNNSVLMNAIKENKAILKIESKISDEEIQGDKTLPPFQYSENEAAVPNTEKCYSCDICGELFGNEDCLLMHISNHNDVLCKCYVCDANFDTSENLQAHLLTHSDIPLEDMDKIIDEDIESNFNKFEEISLEDIEKIGLDDDFDEKVARMYALAHFEISLDENDSTNTVNFEDDTPKECALPQENSSFKINHMDFTLQNLAVGNMIPEASVKSVHKFPSVVGNKNINLQNLETVPECNKEICLNGKFHESISKFDILKKMHIPVKDIDDISLNRSIQEIITKLHSDLNFDFSKESVSEAYKNITNIDLPNINISTNMDIFSKTCDFSAVDSLEGNVNHVIFNDDIIDKIRSLFQKNHPADNESFKAEKNIGKNPSDISRNKNIDEHSKQISVCHICDKTFTRKLYLQAHYLTHLGIKPYRCHICNKSFAKKCALTIHSLIHSRIRKYSCNDCEKSFLRRTDLQKHILIHREQKPYICKVCQKGFSHQNNLRRHEFIHSNKKLHVCCICDKGFSDQISLLSHTKIHLKLAKVDSSSDKFSDFSNYLKSVKDKLYRCEVCGAMFARHDRLVKHNLTHCDKDLYLCEVCGSTYKNKSEFQTHLLNHIDTAFEDIGDNTEEIEDLDLTKLEPSVQNMKKTHTCDQCFKVYNRSSALKYHYLTHTGEKPHKCPICRKNFGQRTTLKRHILAHSGVKSFSCKQCSKSFIWESSLRKHYATHSSK
ncbi:Zinc finger protein 112 [Araneus ventricosus]|uniref:Zinc finger protein 112 n=1 Tax=Araneus ventricosus TaxID=182803 RepID=A0A4Y2IMH7_ARAVE|nr:Zinc finger protein 112 [Araneus ventricosus]